MAVQGPWAAWGGEGCVSMWQSQQCHCSIKEHFCKMLTQQEQGKGCRRSPCILMIQPPVN